MAFTSRIRKQPFAHVFTKQVDGGFCAAQSGCRRHENQHWRQWVTNEGIGADASPGRFIASKICSGDSSMFGDKDLIRDNVVAARSTHARRPPNIINLDVGDRGRAESRLGFTIAIYQRINHYPVGMLDSSRPLPTSCHLVTAGNRYGRSCGRERARHHQCYFGDGA